MRRAGQPSCSQLARRSRYILQARAHQQLFVCCLLTRGRVSSTSRVVSSVENAALPDGSVWIKRLSCRVQHAQLAVAVNASKRLATTCCVASSLTAATSSSEMGQEGELLASVDAWCAAATGAVSSDPEPDDDASSAVERAQLAEQHIKLVQQLLQLKSDHSPQPQKARSKAAAAPPGLLTAACRLHAHLHCVLMWLPDSAASSLPLLFSCAAEFQLPLPSLAQQQVEWLLEHPLWLEALSRPCQDWPQGRGLVLEPGRAPPLLLPLLAALGAAVAVPGAAAPSLPPALEAHIASWPSFSPGQRQDLQQAVWRVEAAAEEAQLEYSQLDLYEEDCAGRAGEELQRFQPVTVEQAGVAAAAAGAKPAAESAIGAAEKMDSVAAATAAAAAAAGAKSAAEAKAAARAAKRAAKRAARKSDRLAAVIATELAAAVQRPVAEAADSAAHEEAAGAGARAPEGVSIQALAGSAAVPRGSGCNGLAVEVLSGSESYPDDPAVAGRAAGLGRAGQAAQLPPSHAAPQPSLAAHPGGADLTEAVGGHEQGPGAGEVQGEEPQPSAAAAAPSAAASSSEVGWEGELLASVDAWCAAATAAATAAASYDPEPDDDASSAVERAQLAEQHIKLVQQLLQLKSDHSPQPQKARSKAAAPSPGLLTAACRLHAHLHSVLTWLPDSAASSLPLLFSCAAEFQLPLPSLAQQQVEWLLEHPLWLEALSRPCQDWPQGHGLVPGPGRAPPLLLPLLAALGAAVAVPGAAAPSLPPALEAHIASWPSFSPEQRQDLQQAVWRVEAAAEEAKLEYSGGEGEGRRKEGGKGQGKGSTGATVGTPAKLAAPGPAAGAGNGSKGQQGAVITSAAQASAALAAIALQQATAEIAVGLRRSASSAVQQEGLPGSAVLANTLAVAGSGGETAGVTSQAGSAPNLQPHPPAAAQGGKGALVKGKGATQQGGGGQVEEGGASQGKGRHGLSGLAGGGESQPHGQGQHGKGDEVARWQDLASATAVLNLDLKTASSNQLQPLVDGWCQALLAAERNGHLKGSSSSSSSSSGGSSQREAKSGQEQAHLEQQALQAIWVKVYQSFLSRLRQLMAGCPSESLEHAQLLSMLQAVQHQLHRVLLCLQPAQTELLVAALQSYINSGKAAVKPWTPATKVTLAHLLAQPAWLDLLCKRETAKSTPIVRIMRVLSLLAVWTNDCPCSAPPELMLRVNKDLGKREMQYVQLAVYCMERGTVAQLMNSSVGSQAVMPSASELQVVLFNCDVDKAESMLTKLQRLQPVPETSTNDAPGSTAEVAALPATPTTVSKATPGPLRDLYASLAKVKNSPGIPSPTAVVHQVHTAVAEIERSSAGLRTGVAHATSPGRAPGKQAHGDTPASGAEAELLSLLAQLLPAVCFGCTASQVLQLLTRLNSLDSFSLRLPKFEPLLTALACRVEGWLDTAQQEHVVPRLIRQLAAGQVPASWSGLLPLAVHTAQHLHAWTPPHCHQALLCLLKLVRATKSTSLHQPLQQALLAAGPVLAQAGSPRPQQQGVVGGSGGGDLRRPVTTTTRNIWGGQAAAVLKPNAVQEDTVAMYAELLEHSPEELVPSVFASVEQAMRQFRHCSNETAVRLAQLVLEQVEGEDMSRDEQGVLQVEPGLVRSLGPLLKNLNTRIEAYGQWGASAAMPVRMLNQLARMSLLLQKEDQVTVRATMKHVGNELQAEWHLEQLDAATLFELTYAVTTVGADDREVYNKLMQASSRRLDGLSATELVACLARQARPIPMSPQATQLFNVTMREAIAKLHKMTAHDLATLIHAISQLHLVRDLPMYTPKLPELCNALATHPSWLAEPDPEDVYLVLASLSLLRWHHKLLLEQAATAVLKNKEARNARIMNKALMCAALLMHSSSTTPKLFSACAQRFASLMRRGELNGRVLARLAWATAVANQNPDCQVPAGQGKAATKTVVRPFVQLLLEALKDKSQSIAASKPLYGSLAFSLRIWAVTLPGLKVPQELVDLRKKESHSSTVSDTQKVVTRILGSTPSLGLHKVQSEVNVGHGWFVDITATGAAGVKYAFEVDGPQHFAANDSTVQLGNTAIRDHCVGKLGYLVVNVTADMLAGQGIMQTNKSMADKQTLGAIKNAMAVAAGKQQKCTSEATYAVA